MRKSLLKNHVTRDNKSASEYQLGDDDSQSDAEALDQMIDEGRGMQDSLLRKTSYKMTAMTEVTNSAADERFLGVQPLNDVASEKIKLLVVQQLETMLVNQTASVARSLAWLVAIPDSLDTVRSGPEAMREKIQYVMLTMVAWVGFLFSSTVLVVTAFMQAPRAIGYVSGACLGLTCLVFSVVVFAKGKPELAGAISPPNLPPAGLRMALTLQQWVRLVGTTKEDVQDMIN